MNEKQVIENLLKGLETDKEPFYTKLWYKILLWISLTACFYFFSWMLDNNISKYIVLISSCLVGGLIGFIFLTQESATAWPIVKQYLDKESLQERLNVLNEK